MKTIVTRKLKPNQFHLVADLLPDNPDNVQSLHFLTHTPKLTEVITTGKKGHPRSFLIRHQSAYQEPKVYSNVPEDIVSLLQSIKDWCCVLVANNVAKETQKLIEVTFKTKAKPYQDVYFVLKNQVKKIENKNVRLLTLKDLPLIKQAPKKLQGAGFNSSKEMLQKGVVAGAIIDHKLVAIAHTSAITPKYADIGVFTHPAFRRQGLSSVAVSLVAQKLKQQGITPVWSTGEDNLPSQNLAKKVGFEEIHRNTYIIKIAS